MYRYEDEMVTVNGEPVDPSLMLDYMDLDAQADHQRITRNRLDTVFNVWKFEEAQETLKSFRSALGGPSTSDDSELRRFLVASCGADDELDVAVLKHFIWQVKRKLLGLGVEHHVMPVFSGATGSGKTVAIQRLLEPVRALVRCPPDLTCLNDERQSTVFQKAFVLFFDEMAHAQRVDVDKLKNKITAPTVMYRPMRTNRVDTIPNNATLIGAANKGVIDLIFDPTSARRFWQFNTLDRMDWETINSVDASKIWACVAVDGAAPVKEVIGEVQARQNEHLRNRDYVEQFIQEDFVRDGASQIAAGALYEDFKNWCEGQSLKPWTRTKFGRRVKDLGVGCHRTRDGMVYELRHTGPGDYEAEDHDTEELATVLTLSAA